MRYIPTCLCLLLLVMLCPAHADIIPKDMKPITLSAIIENTGEFPKYTFVEIETLGNTVRSGSIIGPDGRIAKGYKLNQLHLLAVPKDRLPAAAAPDWQALLDDTAIPRYEGMIEAGQELVPRDSLLSGKTTHYRITAIEGQSIHMEKVDTSELSIEPGVTLGQFNRAFLLTFCVEFIVILLLIRLGYRSKTPGAVRIGFSVLLAQTATLPLIWLLMTQFSLMGTAVFLAAEVFAIVVEGAIYKPLLRMTWTGAMLASMLCNAVSVLVGLWV